METIQGRVRFSTLNAFRFLESSFDYLRFIIPTNTKTPSVMICGFSNKASHRVNEFLHGIVMKLHNKVVFEDQIKFKLRARIGGAVLLYNDEKFDSTRIKKTFLILVDPGNIIE